MVIIIKVEYDRQERGAEFLLDKYKTKQPGEVNGKTDKKKMWRGFQNKRYADIVCTRMRMTVNQKKQVHYLIDDVKELKKLNRRCSNEVIITGLCFYVKTAVKKQSIDNYNICKENGLTQESYITIISNLARHLQRSKPLSEYAMLKGRRS